MVPYTVSLKVFAVPESSDSEKSLLRQDNAELRAQLKESNRAISKLTEQLTLALKGNADLQEQLKDLRNKLDILLQQYKTQTRSKFGKTNETHRPRTDSESQPRRKPPKPKDSAPRAHKKHILDQDLPIQHVHHYIDESKKTCPTCLVETKKVRDQITYQLERVTQVLKKLEHRQEVRSCPKCKLYMVMADKPAAPIPGSYAAPRLLAHIIVSKLAYGLPLYRQAKMLNREKINIPRSTQCDWMLAAARLIEQVYELAKLEVKKSAIIKTDDTEIKIQDPDRIGSMRKGKMTPYIGDHEHPCIVFEFSPDLSFAKNKAFFENGYNGIIQADAAGGWQALFKDGSRKCAGCHAHSRRRYYEYLANNPNDPDCYEVLDIYRELYLIEESIKAMSPAERLAVRRKRSKPLIKQLRAFLLTVQGKYPPTNKLMKAVAYTLNHWIPLTRFLKNGALDIDNNSCERTIKDFVLCRKNFLFVGSNEGGKAAAILLSFIATCHRLSIDPVEYFTDVFGRINAMKPAELATLVPTAWAKLRKQKKVS